MNNSISRRHRLTVSEQPVRPRISNMPVHPVPASLSIDWRHSPSLLIGGDDGVKVCFAPKASAKGHREIRLGNFTHTLMPGSARLQLRVAGVEANTEGMQLTVNRETVDFSSPIPRRLTA